MKFKINILIFFFLLIGASLNGQNQDRPNVLFIIVDDLNDYCNRYVNINSMNHAVRKTDRSRGNTYENKDESKFILC